MGYFISIVDSYGCEIDRMGPFQTENDAHEAGWNKWEGADEVGGSIITKEE